MRRFLTILPWLIALAACTDAPPPDVGPVPAIHVGFPRGGIIDVIRVGAVDSLPLRSAELVAPDGAATRASSLDVVDNPTRLAGTSSLGDPWRTGIIGGNGLNPLPAGGVDPYFRETTQVLLTSSTADIALPDPVAYRRDWQRYRIRLGFGAPGNKVDLREIPAPAPPPPPNGG